MSQLRPRRHLRGPIDEQFWDGCADGELRFQKCASCAALQWPPSEECEVCGSSELPLVTSTGLGAVRSTCVFEREYFKECPPPWPIVLAELDDGPLFIAELLDGPVDELVDGSRVEVTFIDCHDETGEFRLPVFRAV